MNSDARDTSFNKDLFGNNFTWGVSTAATQIEGNCDADGKGPSIWDEFSNRRGKIKNGDKPDTACDFYNRYREDIDTVKQLNIPNFRFSIAWSRILPQGIGDVNEKGIDFYNRVIDYCLLNNIEPWITLYHWDLPLALEKQGGWTNRQVITWFCDYVKLCIQRFGDRIKHWIVMNEPSAFTGAGYFLGLHAPGKTGLKNFLAAAHHAVLSIIAAAKLIKQLKADALVGCTFSCSYIEPLSSKPRDIAAAKRVDALLNRMFIEPVCGLGYPVDDIPALKNITKYFLPGDEENLSFDFDFIGLQCYTREIVKYSFFVPYLGASLVKAAKRKVPVTAMGWEVYPPSINYMLQRFNSYQGIKTIYVTENGAAFPDKVVNNEVNDLERVTYLKEHLEQVLKAKNNGVRVAGYFIWTLTDNFEWAEGYAPRFGLVYVDFKTQQRIVKSSGRWYARFLK